MTELKIFNNEEFGTVRTVLVDGEPYFYGNDIAKCLGYARPRKAILDHCKGVLKQDVMTKGGKQSASFIPESDIYRLILHSKLPSAEKFSDWVTSEVLPSIRKTGGYIAGQETMTDSELLAKALLVAQKQIEERNKRIEEMKPKEVFADAVADSKSTILVGDLAKTLKQNGIDTGARRLFKWMRDNGYLIKREGSDHNMPTQKSMELGLFVIKESVYVNYQGANVVARTPKITGYGQQYFINKILGDKYNDNI